MEYDTLGSPEDNFVIIFCTRIICDLVIIVGSFLIEEN